MDFDVAAYLAGKGYRGKPASGGRELTYPCFFECGEPADSRKRKLYVSVSDGFYQCKVCNTAGGSYTLQKHFGDEPRSGTSDDPFIRRRVLDSATARGMTMLANNDDPLLYLMGERGLDAETIIERKLGFVAGGWSLVETLPEEVTLTQLKTTGLVHREGPKAGRDFFYRHLLIPYLSRGHCIQLRGRIWGEASGGKYMTGPGEPVRLYNADSLEGAEEVIITEGEFDTMILAQALAKSPEPRARKIAVVALPGTNAIPDELDDVLSDVKRIYLGFDSDEPGRRAAENIKERIGARARILELPVASDGRKCDWTEYLLPAEGEGSDWPLRHPYAGHDWRDVLRVLSSAAGKRIFSMGESGESYRTFRSLHGGLSTGFTELDAVLKPGLLPGQVMIVLAKTGTGKSIWLCNLAYNMRQLKVLFVSLEMTREEVYDRMRRIYLFHNPHSNEHDVEDGLSNVFICDENRVPERDFGNLISEFAVEADGPPDVVFVDYLGYFARSATGNSPYEKVSNAVLTLKAEAKAGRFVVVAPSQVSRGAKEGKPIDLDDARDSGAIEETADFLIALFRPDDALTALDAQQQRSSMEHTGKLRCSVLKSRHGGKGKIFSLQMDLLTLAIADENTREARWAAEHNAMLARGHDWESLRRHETRPRQLTIAAETP